MKENLASPPADTVLDLIEETGIPESVYAPLLGFTVTGWEKFKRGDVPLSPPTARVIANVLGSSQQFWLYREIQYRCRLNELAAERIAELEKMTAAPPPATEGPL